MDYLSSMYIDDEMGLNDKKRFVEKVRVSDMFYTQTIELLDQEQLIQAQSFELNQAHEKQKHRRVRLNLFRSLKPLGLMGAGCVTAALILFSFFKIPVPENHNNRFLLFEPAAKHIEIVGSFTNWQRISMKRIGSSGYWELNLKIDSGEHRFSYILDGMNQISDPTLPGKENDDFGGENSILSVQKCI